jgi:hypothetical protein
MNRYRVVVIIAIVAALLGLGVARVVWSDEAVAPMEPVPVATPIPVVVADEPAPEPMTMQSVWDGQNRETRNVICGHFLAQPGATLDQLVSAGNGMFSRDAIMIFLEEKCR